MPKRNGTEYVESAGECPYCGSDSIDGGVDNEFERDCMISDGCKCNSCGRTWAETYSLDGWIERDGETDEYGNDIWHQDTRHQEIKEERDRLQEQVKLLREALEASKSRMEISAEYLHRFQGACAYHGDQLVGAIKRIDATLEATKEKT